MPDGSLNRRLPYIVAKSPKGAVRIRERLNNAIALIADFPGTGHAGVVAGTREFPVSRTSYIIIYRAGEDVEVLSILHGRQNRQAAP